MQTKKRMLNYVLMVIGFAITSSLWAQNVNVSANGGTTIGSYPTLTEAFENINSGYFTGDITVSINASTTEPGPILLNTSGYNATGITPASYTRITIFPSTTATVSGTMDSAAFTGYILNDILTVTATTYGTVKVGQVISGTGIPAGTVVTADISGAGGTGTYRVNEAATVATAAIKSFANLLTLNGATNVFFDGRINRSGNTNGLTFVNNAAKTTASTVLILNESANDTFAYCNIQGASTSNATGTIVIGTTTKTAGNGNDNIVFDYCNISDAPVGTPQQGVHAVGTSAVIANDNCTISNSNIYNFFTQATGGTRGINIGAGNSGWTITGNSFYQTANRSGLTSVFQYLSIAPNTNTDGFTVTNNYFGGSLPQALGAITTIAGTTNTSEFRSVLFATSPGVYNNFHGNIFRNINVSIGYATTTNIQSLLQTNATAINIGNDVSPNFFGDSTGTYPIIVSVGTSAIFSAVVIGHGGNATANIQYNIISGITLNAGSSLRGIQVGNSTSTNTAIVSLVNGNIIGSKSGSGALTTTGNSSMIGIHYASLGANTTALQTITNNTIATLTATNAGTGATIAGISTGSMCNYSIKGNAIYRLTSASAATTNALIGIQLNASSSITGDTVSQNTIYNLVNTSASTLPQIRGIVYTGPTTGANNIISANRIYGFVAKTSGAAILYGMATGTGVYTVSNNVISLGIDSTGNAVTGPFDIRGIAHNSATAGCEFYYNSIRISGVNTNNTKATYAISHASSAVVTYKNNSFYNERTFATMPTSQVIRNYAMYFNTALSSGALAGVTSDYNLLSDSNTNIMGCAAVFLFPGAGTKYAYLADWKTASSHEDNGITGNPNYFSFEDLAPQTGSVLFNAGTPVAITTDYNGTIRNTTTPTIGAGETTQSLPVVLTRFAAATQNQDVKLTWATASELNNAYFMVQRSTDGETFRNIAKVKGNGTTNAVSFYGYTDGQVEQQSSTTVYYRLVQVDFDNKQHTSGVIAVTFENEAATMDMTIAPNPFRDVTNITMSISAGETATMRVFDIQGKMVFEKPIQLAAGQNNIVIDELSAESYSGIYFVQIATSADSVIKRIVKQN